MANDKADLEARRRSVRHPPLNRCPVRRGLLENTTYPLSVAVRNKCRMAGGEVAQTARLFGSYHQWRSYREAAIAEGKDLYLPPAQMSTLV
jgi:hypothetical protein